MPVTLADTLTEVLAREEQWHANPGACWGLDTSFEAINRLTGGLHPGVIFLGARTSHGKSALAMQIALGVAHDLVQQQREQGPEAPIPGKVLIFSPEMNAEELMERFATQKSGVPATDIKTGRADEAARRQWREWAELMVLLEPAIELHAGEDTSFEGIVERVEELMLDQAGGGPRLELVIIDYLQRIHFAQLGGGAGNEYQALTRMANRLKSLANKHRVPFLVASQLNRSIEKDHQGQQVERPPELSDFHGSGAIEAAADMALLLWRPPEPQHGGAETQPVQKATLFCRKNRHGEVGDCELLFYPRLVRFEDPPYLRVNKDGSGL